MSLKSCKEATRLMSEHLDHPLPLHKLILLKMHSAICLNCLYFDRQIRALKKLVGKYAETEDEILPPSTASLSDEVRQRIQSFLRKENF